MDFAFVSMLILKHTGSLIRKYKSTWIFYIWKYDIFLISSPFNNFKVLKTLCSQIFVIDQV